MCVCVCVCVWVGGWVSPGSKAHGHGNSVEQIHATDTRLSSAARINGTFLFTKLGRRSGGGGGGSKGVGIGIRKRKRASFVMLPFDGSHSVCMQQKVFCMHTSASMHLRMRG